MPFTSCLEPAAINFPAFVKNLGVCFSLAAPRRQFFTIAAPQRLFLLITADCCLSPPIDCASGKFSLTVVVAAYMLISIDQRLLLLLCLSPSFSIYTISIPISGCGILHCTIIDHLDSD
ncbi:hypothetical protein LXL04_005103 [Taraxacum kok-saghyz]